MSNKIEMLEVCDENGNVLYLEDRKIIHQQGLLHKEVHVWFFTPDREIIFQHRAKDKDTYPDLLDATVGGHAEPGDSFLQTAIKECLEETGLKVDEDRLFQIRIFRKKAYDTLTNKTNNTIRAQFVYLFAGGLADLKIEEGKSQGFVKMSLEKVSNLTDAEKGKFIPTHIEPEYLEMFQEAVVKLGI